MKEKYSSSSYNQGINFTKHMINYFPIPNIQDKNFFIDRADALILLISEQNFLINPPEILKSDR